MIDENKIKSLINEANSNMEKSKDILGKEIYQKRFKPVFEGYLTAMCSILELDDEETTEIIRGKNEL